MQYPVHIGIVGTGGLGTGLGRDIAASDRGEVAAIADVSDQNRANAGEELEVPVEQRYEDYEAMLAEASLDAVVIATPHSLHHDQTIAAMDAGLDVLCEKPLATDLGDARNLVDRAEGGEETLMVGYQRHVRAPYVTGRNHLADAGATPKFITAEITQPWIDSQLGTWRTDPDLSGGGQLYDTGSHLIDAVLWMTGLTPTSVSAEMAFHDDARRVDTQAMLTVRFESGTVANLSVSGDAPRVREHIHVWSDAGGLYLSAKEWDTQGITYVQPDGSEVSPLLDAPPYPNKIEAFLECVRGGTEPPATARDALSVTAVTEAAYESARTGERVDVVLSE
jgi:predicted dehydrogenase